MRHARMSACVAVALANLFQFFGRKLSPTLARVYAAAVADVSPQLLEAAVGRAMTTRQFLPKPVELRRDAELCRTELQAADPYTPCVTCTEMKSPGWLTVDD